MSLILQITIFLGASLILVPLFKRIGVPTVLGYLLTGILLGPSVFNIANDVNYIQALTEFGIIFLMFIIGLELRPQRLWELRRSIFVIGGSQVIVTGSILILLVFFILGITLNTSLVIGFSLALSSTALILQLLNEKQKLNTTHGQQAFSILLFQDIAAIPLIAILPLLAGHTSAHHGIAYFAAIIATFTGLFLFNRYIIRPFFRFMVKVGAKELITAVGLFIALAVIELMNLLDISIIIGALLTGALLADSEFRHELDASIIPFKSLLLGLFFITVGMTIQLSLFVELPWLIIGGTITLLFIKLISLTAIARYFKYSWPNSLLLATCLAQSGELAFIIFQISQSEGLFTQTLYNTFTLIVTLSMLLTPLLYWSMQRLIIPRLHHKKLEQCDESPNDYSPIIIAGFGRFGQIVAKIAHLQHLKFTVIDSSLDKIDFVRNYGGKVYYGNVTEPDILHSAGIEYAQVFILAIDDVEDSMNVARHICLNYPHLKLLVRARDRHHVHLLRDLGIEFIWRETYLSSLGMAYRTLCNLGISEKEAYKSIELFRDYDEQLLTQQQRVSTDEQKVYESHLNALAELEHLFEHDALIRETPTNIHARTQSRIDISTNEEK